MTSTTDGVAGGTFRLTFSTQQAALTAAREASTRGFTVEVAHIAGDRWDASARARSVVPLAELDRYISRLKRIAGEVQGTYVGYTADDEPVVRHRG